MTSGSNFDVLTTSSGNSSLVSGVPDATTNTENTNGAKFSTVLDTAKEQNKQYDNELELKKTTHQEATAHAESDRSQGDQEALLAHIQSDNTISELESDVDLVVDIKMDSGDDSQIHSNIKEEIGSKLNSESFKSPLSYIDKGQDLSSKALKEERVTDQALSDELSVPTKSTAAASDQYGIGSELVAKEPPATDLVTSELSILSQSTVVDSDGAVSPLSEGLLAVPKTIRSVDLNDQYVHPVSNLEDTIDSLDVNDLSIPVNSNVLVSEKKFNSEQWQSIAKNSTEQISEDNPLRQKAETLQIASIGSNRNTGHHQNNEGGKDPGLSAMTHEIDAVLGEESDEVDHFKNILQSDIAKRLDSKIDPANPVLQSTRINTPFNKPEWGNAVNQRIMWLHNQEVSSAKIIMEPPELGPIEVHLKVQKEASQVMFYTHNTMVKEVLEASLPKLREMFESQGLNLTDADVHDQSRQQEFEQEKNTDNHSASNETVEEENGEHPESVWSEAKSPVLVDYYI